MNEPIEEKNTAVEMVEAPPLEGASLPVVSSGPTSAWRAFATLVDPSWLKNTFKLCIAFAPACILPASLMTFAGLAITFGFHFCIEQLKSPALQLQNLVLALGIMLGMSFSCLIGFIWGFTVWLVRLNTFGHAFCMVDVKNGRLLSTPDAGLEKEAELTPSTLQALFKASHGFILSRKKYLARFYLLVSVIAMVPAFIWMVLCTIKMFSMQAPSSVFVRMALPPAIDFTLIVALVVIGSYLIGLSWISVVVSSIAKVGANQAAWNCIKLSVTNLLPMILLAVLMGVVNAVVATPQLILNPSAAFSSEMMAEDLQISVIAQVWQGITSLVLLTFTLSPFCEMLKDRVE